MSDEVDPKVYEALLRAGVEVEHPPMADVAAQVESSTTLVEIDLHGKDLYRAMVHICEILEELSVSGESGCRFIHGYHHGTAIRKFIRGKGLRTRLAADYPDLPPVSIISKGEGVTQVVFQ